jgi:hypothetical protein
MSDPILLMILGLTLLISSISLLLQLLTYWRND